MPKFSYLACTVKGESVQGSLQASNKTEVIQLLSNQGLFMVSCKIEDTPPAAAAGSAPKAAPRASTTTKPKEKPATADGGVQGWISSLSGKKPGAAANSKQKPKGSVTLKELTVVTRQLSISIHAGMSFVDALQGMAQHNKNPLLNYT